MWTPADRALVGDFGSGQALTDDQFRLLEPLIPPAKPGGRPRTHGHAEPAGRPVLPRAHRLPVAASAAPSGLPALATVYGYMRAFLRDGVWESIRHHFVVMLREGAGREASPTAAIIDTQSVKTTEAGGLAAGMRGERAGRRCVTSSWPVATRGSPGRWGARCTSYRARSSTRAWSSTRWRPGAVLQKRRVRRVEVRDDRVVLDGEVAASVVVGADGVHSVLRPQLLGEVREPRAIAIRGYAPTAEARRGSQVIRYGPRAQPAYAWAFDRGDGWSNVGYGELLPER